VLETRVPHGLFGWCREGELNPKGRSPADFECDVSFPQGSTFQHFLQHAFDFVASLVQFSDWSYRGLLRTLCAHQQNSRSRETYGRAMMEASACGHSCAQGYLTRGPLEASSLSSPLI